MTLSAIPHQGFFSSPTKILEDSIVGGVTLNHLAWAAELGVPVALLARLYYVYVYVCTTQLGRNLNMTRGFEWVVMSTYDVPEYGQLLPQDLDPPLVDVPTPVIQPLPILTLILLRRRPNFSPGVEPRTSALMANHNTN